MFLGLRIELCPYLQYWVSVYTQLLKRRTRKFNFRSFVLQPSIDINISFYLSKVGSPSQGLFIGHPCQVDKFSRPIYRPTAAKRLMSFCWLDNAQTKNVSVFSRMKQLQNSNSDSDLENDGQRNQRFGYSSMALTCLASRRLSNTYRK